MRYGIKDVAARAKVSHTTVSRILRNVEGFSYSPKTRKKVMTAVKEMGYVPNLAAKMIRIKKTNLIGIAVQPENSYGTYRAIENCAKIIRQCQYSHMLIDLEEHESNNGNFLGQIEYLAGVICLYGGQEEKLVSLCKTIGVDIPIVTIKSRMTDSEMVRSVINDSSIGFLQAVNHLFTLGHRNIAYLGHESDDSETGRTALFRQACKTQSVKMKIFPVQVKGKNSSFLSGAQHASVIIKNKKISAAICEDDEFALGLISGLSEQGYQVPRDFSVIGFDDLPFAEFTTPKLTTVRLDNNERMEKAVKLLISLIESNVMQKELLPREIVLETQLIVRETTGKLRKGK